VGGHRQQLSGRGVGEGQDRPAYSRLPAAWLDAAFEQVAGHQARMYAVHTKPRQEKALAERLDADGVSCYVPLTTRLRTWQHRRRVVQEPLFPGYIFAKCSVDDTYAIHSSGRAVQVIPAPDPTRTIRELSQIDRALEGGATLDPYPYLQDGTRVVVARGPLRGIEGDVDFRSSPHRVVLKISTLGRAVALEIDSAALEPLE
jgi:transcription antitermination factor NusG